jgi:hypothetical protein
VLTAQDDSHASVHTGRAAPADGGRDLRGRVYFQCAKALMRSRLWAAGPKPDVPTAGEFIKEMDAGFDAETYDIGYEDYAKPRMW